MTYIWVPSTDQRMLQAGLTRDLAEESANRSGEQVLAPPCHVCDRPVADRDWEAHKRNDHGIRDDVLPYGTADAREVFVAGFGRDDLDQKLQAWRDRHPGLSLSLAGEGSRVEGRLVWARYRVLKDGKPVRG